MSTTEDEELFADISVLADDLGLRRRPYEAAADPDRMLEAVLAERPRKATHPGRRAALAALAVAAVVVRGFVVLGGDRAGDADRPTALPAVSLDLLLDPPVDNPDRVKDRVQASLDTEDATAYSAPLSAVIPGSGKAELFRSNCTTCRNAVGPVDTVVLVDSIRPGRSGDRATVVRTFRGTAVKGDRVVIRDVLPTLELSSGLGPRPTVYFLRMVGDGVYSNAASAYVEARPGQFSVRRVLPLAPVRQFSLEQLERATD